MDLKIPEASSSKREICNTTEQKHLDIVRHLSGTEKDEDVQEQGEVREV